MDLFFIISGFVMVVSTEGQAFRPSWFIDRFWRVVPLWWVALTGWFLVRESGMDAETILRSYLLVPFLDPDGRLEPHLSVGWTLYYEVFFYGLFGLALWARAPVLPALALLVLAGEVAGRDDPLSQVYLSRYLLEFAAGVAIARMRRHVTLSFAPLAVVGVVWLIVAETAPMEIRGPACVLLFLGVLALENHLSRVSLPFLLGSASYSIYLFHSFAPVLIDPAPLVRFVGGVGVGLLAYLLIERPGLQIRPRSRPVSYTLR